MHVRFVILIAVFLAFAEEDDTSSCIVLILENVNVNLFVVIVFRNVVVAAVVLADILLYSSDIGYLFLTRHVLALYEVKEVVYGFLKLVRLVIFVGYFVLILLCKQLGFVGIVAVVALCYVVDTEIYDAVVGAELHVGKPYLLLCVVAAVDGS